MTVILKYSFSSQNNEDKKQVSDLLSTLGFDLKVQTDRVYAETEYDFSSDEPVEKHFLQIAVSDYEKILDTLKKDFSLSGVIDTSSLAGEYMDFCICKTDGKVFVKASDWYQEEWMDGFDDYDDFHECYPMCSEEEYKKLKENEFAYYWQDKNGDYVFSDSVPLHDVTIE